VTETRACAYEECPVEFNPKRPHQRFHSEPCRYAQWELEKAREGASGGRQRVEGGVGSRGGNVRSVTEARQLQTASKGLDRWRLVMEVQIHRTLLATGHFHVDDLDCLGLPPEAFEVRGTLVSAVRASGVMRSTGVTRKVAHKAANARKAPIYAITPKGRTELTQLAGSSSDVPYGASPVAAASSQNQGRSGEKQEIVGTGIEGEQTSSDTLDANSGDQSGVGYHPSSDTKSDAVSSQPVAADTGSSPDVLSLDEARRRVPSAYDPWGA
jgi:hypothetical protein